MGSSRAICRSWPARPEYSYGPPRLDFACCAQRLARDFSPPASATQHSSGATVGELRYFCAHMTRRTGSADLPLHTGRVPPWLASRMASLGAIVTQAIVHHYGRDAFLQRLSHPFWFQSFGAVMGMDWHSSGITTSVIGALKRGLAPLQDELGIYVCGGRGRHSRKTPLELATIGDRIGFDGQALTRAS